MIVTKWLKSFRKPEFQVRPEHKVIPAFISNGVQYFMFDKALELSYERALWAHSFYVQFENKVSKEYLKEHVKAMKMIVSSKRIDIGKIAILNKNLEEKLEFIIEPDLLYQLASVQFFDASEDPYKFDHAYSIKKIERWKKSADIETFFLSLPVQELIPYLKQSGTDIKTYSTAAQVIIQQHQKYLTSILSSSTSIEKNKSA